MEAQQTSKREVPSRGAQAGILVGMFFGGGGLGILLSWLCAPESGVAGAVGLMMLPVGMFIGLQFWLGLAIFVLAVRLIAGLLRHGRPNAKPDRNKSLIPPGSFAFVPGCFVAALAAGVITGLVGRGKLSVVLMVYVVTGVLYGIALWRLARSGFLPFPEGE